MWTYVRKMYLDHCTVNDPYSTFKKIVNLWRTGIHVNNFNLIRSTSIGFLNFSSNKTNITNKIPLIKYLLLLIINPNLIQPKIIKVNLYYVAKTYHTLIVLIPFLTNEQLGPRFFDLLESIVQYDSWIHLYSPDCQHYCFLSEFMFLLFSTNALSYVYVSMFIPSYCSKTYVPVDVLADDVLNYLHTVEIIWSCNI